MDKFHKIQKNFDSTHLDLSKTVPNASLAPFPAELGAFEVWAFLVKITPIPTESDIFGIWGSSSWKKSCFESDFTKYLSVTFFYVFWANFPETWILPIVGGSFQRIFRVWGRKRDFLNFQNWSHVPHKKSEGGVEIRVYFQKIKKFRKFPKFWRIARFHSSNDQGDM